MSEAPWRAACMSDQEWALWTESNARVVGAGHAVLPCEDCLPSFAAEMRAVGRCNGVPKGAEPMETSPGESPFLGSMADAHRQRGRDAQAAGRLEARPNALELVPETPCGTCAHAPVCAWKLTLDAIDEVGVRIPVLEDGLVLTLHATVECSQYLRAKSKAIAPVGGHPPTRKPLSAEHREAIRRGQERARAAKAGTPT